MRTRTRNDHPVSGIELGESIPPQEADDLPHTIKANVSEGTEVFTGAHREPKR